MKFINKNDFDEVQYTVESKQFLEERKKQMAPITLDIRPKDDYEKEHIVGAYSMPADMLKDSFKQIPVYARIILYGDDDDSSTAESIKFLLDNRFSNVAFVKGGVNSIMKALESSPDELILKNIPKEEWNTKIEEVLEQKVKPMLAADGGGLEVVKIEGAKVYINYQGACSGCASAATGTLNYIKHTLSISLNHEIEIIMA